jgi:hypothetical protein
MASNKPSRKRKAGKTGLLGAAGMLLAFAVTQFQAGSYVAAGVATVIALVLAYAHETMQVSDLPTSVDDLEDFAREVQRFVDRRLDTSGNGPFDGVDTSGGTKAPTERQNDE